MPERGARRWLTFLLAAVLALALAACTGGADAPPSPPATPIAASPTATAATTPVATSTPTPSPTPTPTATLSPAPTATATATTPVATPTPSPTSTATPTPTPTASATSFRYDTYDTSGEVAEPGSYAFLADPADTTSAVTTYEGLRDGSATALRIHETDADGVSRAAFLDTVEAGDLFEWRQAEDCFVRYKVTEVLPDPSGTPRRLLGVEWMTYAFTGCSGAVSANAAATVDWGELPVLGGASLQVPIVHGTAQLVPPDWAGSVKRAEFHDHFITESAEAYTTDPAEARELDYWREPELPPGWRLARAFSGGVEGPPLGYCAHYLNVEGRTGVYICGYQDGLRYEPREAHIWTGLVFEARIVAGRPAVVQYNPNPEGRSSITVWVYDAATEGVYYVDGRAPSHVSGNVEAVDSRCGSLFEPPNPLPPQTTFRYDSYDTSGAVAEPGSYAFLADPGEATSAVTTYEGLRDGSATALRIHDTDADGVSRAAFLDTVEAGDLFEWREAEDCWVRYRITEVKEDPTGAVPRKAPGVEWATYAYTGCTGAIPSTTSVALTWARCPEGPRVVRACQHQ